MILKITAIGLVSAVLCLHIANGASFSKVYVQSGGPDVAPVEYYNYGAPVISNPQLARLSAPPLGSLVPVSNVIPPCISPCVIPNPGVATSPNAKFITYNSPNVPVVVAPNNDNGYEYSYVVYDESTGDRKAQRELSDGSVVRGEYSFLQPDGYVREVQYRADDLTGFNVVVKRILPEAVGVYHKKENSEQPPCPIKHEDLKVQLHSEAHDHGTESHVHEAHAHDSSGRGHEAAEHGHDDPAHNAAEHAKEVLEHGHDAAEHSHETTEHVHKAPEHGDEATGHVHEVSENMHDEPEHGHDAHDHEHDAPEHVHEPSEHGHENPDHGKEGHVHTEPGHEGHEHDHEHIDPAGHVDGSEANNPTHEAIHALEPEESHEPEKELVQEHEHVHEPEPEQHHEAEPAREHTADPHHETHQAQVIEVHHEAPIVTHEAVVEAIELSHEESAPSVVFSYEDVLRCLQAKGQAQRGLNFSPLTYIILPASNRPC